MDFELDLSSENMTSFLELEQEIKEATTNLPEHLLRPSVIVKPRAKPAAQKVRDWILLEQRVARQEYSS